MLIYPRVEAFYVPIAPLANLFYWLCQEGPIPYAFFTAY